MCLRDGQLNVQRCGYIHEPVRLHEPDGLYRPDAVRLGDVAQPSFRTHLLMVCRL